MRREVVARLLSIPVCPVIMFAEKFHTGSDKLFFIPDDEMQAHDEPQVFGKEDAAIVMIPRPKFEAMKAVSSTWTGEGEGSEWASVCGCFDKTALSKLCGLEALWLRSFVA